MALDARLEATFTGDGAFDFAASMSGLEQLLADADFGDVQVDAGPILDVLAGLAPPDLSSAIRLAAEVGADIGASLGAPAANIPTAALLAPITDVTAALSGLRLDSLDALAADVTSDVGLGALQARLATVTGGLAESPITAVTDLVARLVPGLSLPDTAATLGPLLDGLLHLATLLGGLLAIESTSRGLADRAVLLSGIDTALAQAAGETLARLSVGDLAARIRAADPGDAGAVDGLSRDVVAFLDAVHLVGDEWARALGFGEAALVGLDVEAGAGALGAARVALGLGRVDGVAGMATTVRAALDPVLSLALPDPAESLEQALNDAFALVVQLTQLVEGVDAAALVAPLTTQLDAVTAPVRDLATAIASVGASIETAIAAVGDLVAAIDLSAVSEAVTAALQPVVDAMATVEGLVAGGQDAIETVADRIVAVLDDVHDAVAEVAGLVQGALSAVSDVVTGIDFAAVQAQIEAGLGAVADALDAAQISPYTDASVDVIETTAEIVDTVPFGMLPTDVQQEIVDACKPVKAIDFSAIADALTAELDGIIAALDTDVLAEVDAAYQAVVGFLASIDPRAAIDAFEAGAFAELEARVLALDPSALFAPVSEALDSVRGLLADVDLTAELLGPLEDGFAVLRERLAELDPAALLQPAREEVDAVRADIEATLHLDTWADAATTTRTTIEGWLDRLDPAALAAALSDEVGARLAAAVPATPGVIGTLVAALAKAGGLPADAGGMGEVLSWLGGADGRTVVSSRLQVVADGVTATRDAVRTLDPAPLLAAASAHHRALSDAVASHPAGSLLRTALEPLLAGTRPGDVLAPLAPNRARYLARLDVDVGIAGDLAAAGNSDITTTSGGLRDALTPLASVVEWARTLLDRFGLTTEGGPLGALLAVWLDQLGPHRVVPPLVGMVEALRTKAGELVTALLAPVEETAAAVGDAVAVIDLGPVVDELTGIHAAALAQLEAVSPSALLGPVVGAVDEVVDALEAFDPLAPVEEVITALRASVTEVFDTLRPSVLFADATTIYTTVVTAAQGLDVRALLDPVLSALDGLATQLGDGLDEVATALGRLQDALPDSVTDSGVSGSVSVGVSL